MLLGAGGQLQLAVEAPWCYVNYKESGRLLNNAEEVSLGGERGAAAERPGFGCSDPGALDV
jgi:hypothetical protein